MIPLNNANIILSQGADNSAFDLKAKTTQVNASGDFKDIFARTMTKTNNRETVNSGMRNEKEFSSAADSQTKYKTFRGLRTEQSVKADQNRVELSDGDISTKNVDSTVNKTAVISNEYNDQINVLAQLLGITPAELVKLVEALGFSAEDFNNIEKLSQIVEKLGDQLQLSSSQKDLLAELTKEVSNQIAGADNKPVEKQLVAEPSKAMASQAASDTQNTDLSGIAENIKSKLNELLQKAQSETEAIRFEVSKVIEAMKSQSQNRVAISLSENMAETVSTTTISAAEQKLVDAAAAKADNKASDRVKEEKGEVNAVAENDQEATEVKTVSVQVNTGSDQNPQEQALSAFSDIKTGVLNNQTQVTKAEFKMPQPVKTSDLINQVVEQTKVIIGHDRTEMVIHLKPDHLGKLELKVVTEQGIVAAKFIAESQQVKEIIETNMQQLKESLQKQGINIDGVSVQVGQDKKNEYQSSSFANKSNGSANKAKHSSVASAITGTRGTLMETLPERLAQYSYETSTINLTA